MIEVADQTFSSVANMQEYVHNILINATIDEPLSEADEKVIHELFLHHPEANEKMGGEQPQYFKVGKHPEADARAFCIVRTDGVAETFSMKKCVSARARVEREKQSSTKSTANKKKKPARKKKPSNTGPATENVGQEVYAEGISGLVARFQRVVELHAELGEEIEQIKKILADESQR